MINILSIGCGLAFAPYLADSLAAFLADGAFAPLVVRQGGSGLIIRHDAEVMLRYQNRESVLDINDARHYLATICFRAAAYDITRMADEVVMANIDSSLLLAHPQSELWLEAGHVANLLCAVGRDSSTAIEPTRLPDWLNVSTSAERLLLSDQRNGRWVLLGADHLDAMARRLSALDEETLSPARQKPPTFTVKSITVHLQSAFKLADALEALAESGQVLAFAETTPIYSLAVGAATEGLELRDWDRRVGMNQREARKWASVIRHELARVNAVQMERGRIRTVIADGEQGRWILQWGDEVLVPSDAIARLPVSKVASSDEHLAGLRVRRTDEMMLLLAPTTGACVALTDDEAQRVHSL
jgi:hypothetical protein